MEPLIVSIERNGEMVQVGTISGTGVSDARFQYSAGYSKASEIAEQILCSGGIAKY